MTIYAAMSDFVTEYTNYDTEQAKTNFAFRVAFRYSVICTKFEVSMKRDLYDNPIRVLQVEFTDQRTESSVSSTFKMED